MPMYRYASVPRFNLVRYYVAPASKWRIAVVPFVPGETDSIQCPGCDSEKREKRTGGENIQTATRCHPRNYSWAELLKRVFEIDVLECPECGGRMRILCEINPPEAIRLSFSLWTSALIIGLILMFSCSG